MTKLTLTHDDAEVSPSELTGSLVVKAYRHISKLLDSNNGSVNVSDQAAHLFDTYDTLCGTLMAQQRYESDPTVSHRFNAVIAPVADVETDGGDGAAGDTELGGKDPKPVKDPVPTTHPAHNGGKEKGK